MSVISDLAKKLFETRKEPVRNIDLKSFVPLNNVLTKLGAGDLGFFQSLDFYSRVSVISTCVDLIAESFSQLTPRVVDKFDNVLDNTEVDTLLQMPSNDKSWTLFAQELAAYYLITGNSFLLATGNTSFAPNQLIVMKPTDVSVNGYSYYINDYGSFKCDSVSSRFVSDRGLAELCHIKRFNPNIKTDSITLGQSKLQSIYNEIELFEAGHLFNNAVLNNGAKPSGLVLTDQPLQQEEYDRLRAMLTQSYAGAGNAGKIMVFAGMGQNTTFQQLSLSSSDMQFRELNEDCVKRICNRLQVPLPLVIPDASTYNNMASSILFLYDNSVFPLADVLFDELTRFLIKRYPKLQALGCRISYDKEQVDAVKQRTVDNMLKKANTGLFTTNELRSEVGYEDIEGGDLLTGSTPTVGMYDTFQGVLSDAGLGQGAGSNDTIL